MKHKVTAQIKGSSYGSSITFIIEDTKALQKIIEAIDGLPQLDSTYVKINGELEHINYENGPLSIEIKTNVPVHSKDEKLALEKQAAIDDAAEEQATEKVEPGESDPRD